ncbi:MAG: trypsin-like peptidase domain-containing protein [Dehalococcoidia bacterium]
MFISAEVETESFFFGKTVQEASGSGVIVSPDGYILTNNHVVEGASKLEVTLSEAAHAYEAEIVGVDPLTDLAVIKIDGENLPTVPFGDASALQPGNLVIAMGYPLALDEGATITMGVVSNTERSFSIGDSTYYDVIQTDAAINQGNSGGPLVDMTGRIVGINSVLFGGAQNIGFAVSVNTAEPVYEALIGAEHRMVRPWLGVILADVTPDLADEANLSRQSGVVITSVVANSPADEAGLQVRDVVTRFEGEEMTTASQLIRDLWRHKLGEEVTITFWRDGEKKQTKLELTVERPE